MNYPNLMKQLANPLFVLTSCSDSQVGEGTVFNARPGLFFSEGNIANKFIRDDGKS
ncbi:hypothetical protein D9615_005964 [Tricholomella constricta]|uniref:Uncharacterized protein n=1 Tax=Tricholomella constricta TaxID=117010 RepID=A0A8H5H9Q5_9AGAR|nr:hypothetical protein D9615_005964 [Tricholomella constricta]